MSEAVSYKYDPDYAVHPGVVLEEHLEANFIKKKEFADRCGITDKTVSQIVNNHVGISPENALRFEHVLGVSAEIWNNLTAQYELAMAKKVQALELSKAIKWSREFPIRQMILGGWLCKESAAETQVGALLDFFGVASVKAFEQHYNECTVRYRKSPAFESNKQSVAAWLRIGEIRASELECREYDRDTFKESLLKIRSLTSETPDIFVPHMKELCRDAGVALVFTPEFPKTRLSGATRWVSPGKALIMLSLRYKTNDQMWFTFFHEAGHVLLHGKRDVFIDEAGMELNKEEVEANKFAADLLIPPKVFRLFLQEESRFSKSLVLSFAEHLGIAPGIVVGRLQRERKISFKNLNGLKKVFEFGK